MSYSPTYYEQIRDGAISSAEAVVPLVLDVYDARTVVDVGCGEGHWGKAFAARGCTVLGLEAHGEPVIDNRRVDLAEPFALDEDFDLAVCLEVAEHLPPERGAGFVHDLCQLAPVVLFSAAIPEQGGEGHLNEQWPAYWVEKFEEQGFRVSDTLRWRIWEDDRVDSWYRQNLLVAAAEPIPVDLELALDRWGGAAPVVHPAFLRDLMAFIHVQASLGKIEWK